MQKERLPGLIEVRIFIKPARKCHSSNLMNSISQNVIKHKVGLLNLAAELGNVSRAYKVMGFSRDTFYRYQSPLRAAELKL